METSQLCKQNIYFYVIYVHIKSYIYHKQIKIHLNLLLKIQNLFECI